MHGVAQLWSNDHTHDEHCDTPSSLGVCNSQLVLLQGNTGDVTLVDVIRTLKCVDGWSSASGRQEVKRLRHL